MTPSGCNKTREVERGRFAFGVRIGGEDDFVRVGAPDLLDEFFHAQLRGADAVHRRDQSAEHVIAAAIRARAFDRVHVFGFGDDANDGRVAPLVGAELARIVFGERIADRAEAYVVFYVENRFGQRLGFVARAIE